MNKIQYNSQVSLRYQLTLEDGTDVESNYDDEPLVVVIGDGSLTDGMEFALIDHQPGDSVKVLLTPEQAYGYPDKDNIHSMPASDFPDELSPEVGQVIAFDGPDDEEFIGTIIKINKDEVQVDFSHPLAGRCLNFSAEILEVIPAEE